MPAPAAEGILCFEMSLTRFLERDVHRVTTVIARLAALDPMSNLSRLPYMSAHLPCHGRREQDMALLMRLTISGQRASHMIIVHQISSGGDSGDRRTGAIPALILVGPTQVVATPHGDSFLELRLERAEELGNVPPRENEGMSGRRNAFGRH